MTKTAVSSKIVDLKACYAGIERKLKFVQEKARELEEMGGEFLVMYSLPKLALRSRM